MSFRSTSIVIVILAILIAPVIWGLQKSAHRAAQPEQVDHEPKQLAGDNLDDVARHDLTFGSVAKADDDT
jgi:hypothetical protein